MTSNDKLRINHIIRSKLKSLHDGLLESRSTVNRADLCMAYKRSVKSDRMNHPTTSSSQLQNHSLQLVIVLSLIILSILFAIFIIQPSLSFVLGMRCFVPNNYLIWEATRPIADCQYCKNIDRPLILPNLTRSEFLVSVLCVSFSYFRHLYCICFAKHMHNYCSQ